MIPALLSLAALVLRPPYVRVEATVRDGDLARVVQRTQRMARWDVVRAVWRGMRAAGG